MLIRQIFRDIRHDWLQFLSVFLMSFLCLLAYSALIGISAGMTQQATHFFEQSNLSTALLTAETIDSQDITALKKIDGIKAVEPRLLLTGELLLDQDSLNLVLTATNDGHLSQPLVTNGPSYGSREGLWLNKEVANYHHLKLEDKVLLELNQQRVETSIVGFIQQPEYLYFPESVDYPYPNYKKKAYGFISKKHLSDLLSSRLPDNQLNIEMNTENFNWFQLSSQEILGERYQQLIKTKDSRQISDFLAKQQQIEKLALLFPFLFIFLSGLTMASTMTRFIQHYQVSIGTYKALGFKNSEIYRHYLCFGLIISGIGSLIGIALGPTVIAPLLITFLKEQYGLPSWEISFDPSIWLVSLLLIACCLVTTYFPCRKILKQPPANSLRTQMVDQYQPGFIERSGLLQPLSFTNHWVARGILRNKGRSLMGIFGALGCTILLVAGIGINGAIHYTIDYTFRESNQYEEQVSFEEGLNEKGQSDITTLLHAPRKQWLEQRTIDIIDKQQSREQLLSIIEGTPLIQLLNKEGQLIKLTALRNNEVVVTKKLASKLNLTIGDTVYYKLPKEQLFSTFMVKDITTLSSPQGIITTKNVWEKAGNHYEPSSLLLKEALNTDLRKELKQEASVKGTRLKQDDYQDALTLIQSIVIIVALIVIAAVFLGLVILANFNLLIFSERYREFATLKVLGFKQSELRRLSFRENLCLTFIGLSLGFIAGRYFLQAYVTIISPDNQEYLIQFGWQQFLIVSAIVLTCSFAINLLLDHKIRRIPMAESLKSNE